MADISREGLLQLEAHEAQFTFLRVTERGLANIDFDWARLGVAIGQSNLKGVHFSWPSKPFLVQDLEAFCRGLIHNRSIEIFTLDAGSTQLFSRGEAPGLIESFFRNNRNLKTFNVWYQTLEPERYRLISSILRASPSIKKLHFEKLRGLTNDMLGDLFSLMGRLQTLEILELSCFTIPGLANLLQNPKSNLGELRVKCSSKVVNDFIQRIMPSMDKNTKLKHFQLNFNFFHGMKMDDLNWEPLERTLCFHNHTLEWVTGTSTRLGRKINSLLQINRWENKQFVRMRKSLDYDFLKPSRGIYCELLEDGFELSYLPYLLLSIGATRSARDIRSENYRRSALYHFIRNKPLLVVRIGSGKR